MSWKRRRTSAGLAPDCLPPSWSIRAGAICSPLAAVRDGALVPIERAVLPLIETSVIHLPAVSGCVSLSHPQCRGPTSLCKSAGVCDGQLRDNLTRPQGPDAGSNAGLDVAVEMGFLDEINI